MSINSVWLTRLYIMAAEGEFVDDARVREVYNHIFEIRWYWEYTRTLYENERGKFYRIYLGNRTLLFLCAS